MAGDGHTRLVGWLKVALPLLALALLSTLFLVARTIDPGQAIPYTEAELADRLREPRMTAPAYAGVTADGAKITFTADEARPAGPTGASALKAQATLATPDGARTTVTAGVARMLGDTGHLVLESGVLLATSAGYEMRTDAISLALDRTGAESTGPVDGFGPPGRISAGRMVLSENLDAPGQYLLVFNERVRLIYEPGKP